MPGYNDTQSCSSQQLTETRHSLLVRLAAATSALLLRLFQVVDREGCFLARSFSYGRIPLITASKLATASARNVVTDRRERVENSHIVRRVLLPASPFEESSTFVPGVRIPPVAITLIQSTRFSTLDCRHAVDTPDPHRPKVANFVRRAPGLAVDDCQSFLQGACLLLILWVESFGRTRLKTHMSSC